MRFLGVDGCRGGWLVAEWQGPCWVARNWLDVVAQPFDFLAVDMPVGLAQEARWRDCDRLARERLGPRRSSVFAAPTRSVLGARDYQEVRRLGYSWQSFSLFGKIRQIDEWITPERQQTVMEVHPELAFAHLAGAPMVHSKRTPEGLEERAALLRPWLEIGRAEGGDPPHGSPLNSGTKTRTPPSGAARDDLHDALALAWMAAGAPLRTLPDCPPRDARGLRMEIGYARSRSPDSKRV